MPLTDKFNRETHFTQRALFTCFPVEAAAAEPVHVHKDRGVIPREASELIWKQHQPGAALHHCFLVNSIRALLFSLYSELVFSPGGLQRGGEIIIKLLQLKTT